jgi:hypothetical protein
MNVDVKPQRETGVVKVLCAEYVVMDLCHRSALVGGGIIEVVVGT